MEPITALVLRADGTHADITLDPVDGSELDALYAAIGRGCRDVDVVDFPVLPGTPTMWVDGESLFHAPDAPNLAARQLYLSAYPHPEVDVTSIVLMGDVVLTGCPDDDGDTQSLSAEARADIATRLALA